jgi:hypothetical protein
MNYPHFPVETPSTVYSMLNKRRRDISVETIKNSATAWKSHLAGLFTSSEIDSLEYEIKEHFLPILYFLKLFLIKWKKQPLFMPIYYGGQINAESR